MPQTAVDVPKLKEIARELRIDIIRILCEAGSGHPGGSLSAIDILITLFFYKMRHRPDDPGWTERDRFVLSKGHAIPALYATLARAGYFPRQELWTLRKIDSRLQGHPDRYLLPCLESSTGSLGQGLSTAQGLALASKLDGNRFRVYCLIGDGESQAGQIWEAAMSAPKFKLHNLVTILDYNGGQIDGPVHQVMDIEPVREKWLAFNWHVLEIDGHDFGQIAKALDEADTIQEKPTIIIAHTIKGKGVSFMEGKIEWHGKAPNRQEAEQAIAELAAETTAGS